MSFKRALKKGRKARFLVTAAQNDTAVHEDFLKSLETYAHLRNVDEIIVVPYVYRGRSKHPEWDTRLKPYLYNQRKNLNKNLMLLADVQTSPTAINPLAGYQALTHGESGIIGHPKLAMETVPTPQNKLPKIMTTTGAVTRSDYAVNRAGKLGGFHHTIGAALVEVDGGTFHLRQINADKTDGHFTDLDATYWTNGTTLPAPRPDALILGDLHHRFRDAQAWAATQEQIKVLRPRHIIWHDVLDSYVTNPHHGDNFFILLAKIRNGLTDVQKEMDECFQFIVDETPDDTESIVVFSNHNEMLHRWILRQDPRMNPTNLQFWCKTVDKMAEATKLGPSGTEYPDPFVMWGREYCNQVLARNIRFLERDESFMLNGVEQGMHGHDGPNGARGSRKNLRRIGVKSNIGHTHSPGFDEGCMQVACLTALRQEYHRGPGSSLHGNGLQYAGGKRTLLNIIKGKWRLDR